MSHPDCKHSHQGAGVPPPRCPRADNPAFLPRYEAQVNQNLRNFDRIEDQSGPKAHNQHTPNRSCMTRNQKIFTGLALLLVICVAIATPLLILGASHHTSTTTVETVPPPSDGLQSRETTTAAATNTQLTVTSHPVTTHFAITTVTETAPLPTSIAQAASSYYDSIRSLEASIHSSLESRLSEALTYPGRTTSTAPEAPIAPVSHATRTTTLDLTATEVPDPATTPTTVSAWLGFCGVPGMFCERAVESEPTEFQRDFTDEKKFEI